MTPHRGFALVATLSLMILLTIIAVALLSLASVTMRSGGHGELQAQARANARLALMMALGDLQKHAGPDTRVTANANQQNAASPNPHWLGVWKTRPDEDLAAAKPGAFPIGIQNRDVFLTDKRTPKAAASRWLVSSPDAAGASPDTAPDGSFVTLLETGRSESTVKVPKLPLDGSSACAWWVSDESQKALINLPDAHKDSAASAHFSLAASQDFDFETYGLNPPAGKPLAGLAALDPKKLNSVVSLETGGLLPVADPEAFRKSIDESSHHLTADSLGLFTNVRDSGLKRDLSAFLALGTVGNDPSTGLRGLNGTDPILPGKHHLTTGPRFGILKGWADLADQLDNDSGAAAMTPQPPNVIFQSYTSSAPGAIRDLTNVSKPAIQPVVVEASLGWDFSPYAKDASGAEYLRSHIYPRLTLWNPFNVTLKATRFVVMLRHPTYGSFTARGIQVNSRSSRLYFDDMCGAPTSRFLGFVTEPTDFLPGETKIFTPSATASGGAKLHGRAAAFDPFNYNANILTSQQIPGVENFHFNTNTLLPAETAANQNTPYGFSSNSNSFYSNGFGFDDEFIVAQVSGGAAGVINWGAVTANTGGFPRVAHFICQNWGLSRYSKWYGAERSNHPSNNGTPFREFKPDAPGIGALDNRRPPRLWRRGVRMAWFDDKAEYVANGSRPALARYTQPWFSSSNIRGGLVYHRNWVNLPFSPGWDRPAFDSHTYFLQPTDPQQLATFFPPSPFAKPDDGFPSTCALYDVPRRKTGIISLGQLQHAQLSYSTWHPSFVIGHGERTMNADLDATAIKAKVKDANRWKDNPANPANVLDYDTIIQKGRLDEVLVYDLSFEANEALWDRFMLSSIPYQGAPGSRRPNWDTNAPLPVGRYAFSPVSSRMTPETVENKLSSDPTFPYFRSAEFLTNRGAFNINSTSIQAWTALLGSMRGLQRESIEGTASAGEHPLSRSILSGEPGSLSIAHPSDSKAWNAFRSLSDADIANLSAKIVDEVRKRGPFLSVADFVNRRLTTDVTLSASGTLDQAIANSNINSGLEIAGKTELTDVGPVPTAANRSRSISYGMPGHFSQGDLLTALAPVITARGDTFRIRAYGEASSKDGKVARAWCEAVVQRNVDYVDPADDPLKPAIDLGGTTPVVGSISKSSLAFGRRFTIRSFRWLSASEIQNPS
jgi:hypothetical protein